MKPKVTIVTVCRNAGELLRATVENSIAQRYPNKEIVVVDGASTDGSAEYLASLGSQIDRYVSEPDGGIFDAMNKGVRMATGEWVIFMNAGDTFAADDVIERIFGETDLSGYGVVYGDVVKAGRDGVATVKKAEAPHNSHRMFYCHQSSFVRRELLLSTPFETRHRMSADICQVKQLMKKGVKFRQVDLAVAVFDTGGVSNTRRSEGLRDNIAVVMENDTFLEKCRLLPRLVVPYLICKLRGK